MKSPITAGLLALALAAPVGLSAAASADTPAPTPRASASSTSIPTPTRASSPATSSSSTTPSTTPSSTETPSPQPPSSQPNTSGPATPAPSTSERSEKQAVAPSDPPATASQVTVGDHVKDVPGLAALGSPVGPEGVWASAGGGYAQRFENGWALIRKTADGTTSGTGGIVTGALLAYFETHGYVSGIGWPSGNATSDAHGTWQHFDSTGHSVYGALMTSGHGTFAVRYGHYDTYMKYGLRSRLGSATGEERRWATGGGGSAQPFVLGWSTYRAATVAGYIPNTFAWPDLASVGWPTSLPTAQCGTQRITTERGSITADGRWCPGSSYAQPSTTTYPAGVAQTMTYGMNGIKVYWAQQKLGIAWKPMNSTLGPTTQTKLRSFQKSRGITQTGNIDPATWSRLVGSAQPWTIDAWKQPSIVPISASRATRVNAMVSWAKSQAGKRYIWGSTGPTGYDCAGFLLQAMRAGGVDPTRVSNSIDSSVASDLSWRMYLDPEFQDGSIRSLQIGDLVYYGDSKRVRHVVMYIGGGQYLQAVGDRVHIVNNASAGWSTLWGVNRAFAL